MIETYIISIKSTIVRTEDERLWMKSRAVGREAPPLHSGLSLIQIECVRVVALKTQIFPSKKKDGRFLCFYACYDFLTLDVQQKPPITLLYMSLTIE